MEKLQSWVAFLVLPFGKQSITRVPRETISGNPYASWHAICTPPSSRGC